MDFAELIDDLRPILNIFTNEVFWSALGALGSILALVFIYSQIKGAASVSAYQFLRSEDDRFTSTEFRMKRSLLARAILRDAENFRDYEDYADAVLSFFEDLGLMLRSRIATARHLWAMNAYYITRYWAVLFPYIQWARIEYDDDSYFEEFERLHRVVAKLQIREAGPDTLEFSGDDKRAFLKDEIGISIRRFEADDMSAVLRIEKSSFREADAYTSRDFKQLAEDHPEGFLVADIMGEVVGYSIAYVEDKRGEIVSVAVDEDVRQFGVGKKLIQPHLRRFRGKNLKTCSLEVRTTNESALHFYENLGFGRVEELPDYYAEGVPAYRMELGL